MSRLKPPKKDNKTRPKYKGKNNRNSESEDEYDDYDNEDIDKNEENEVESESESETGPNIQRRKTTRPTQSDVWKHFDKKTEHRVCRRCKKKYKASTCTTTLRRHLKTHGINALKRNQIVQKSKDDQEECVRLVINWFLCNNIPFSAVECEEWQKMITNFGSKYQFLNQHTLNEGLATLFEEKKKEIKLMVQNLKIACTTFAWISNDIQQLYLSIHFVDNSWKLNSFLLNIVPIETCYSKDIMANRLMEVLNELGLAEKTLALTTNHTFIPNKSKKLEEEFNNLGFAHYRCAAHVLNQAVIKGIDLIKASIDKVRLLMAHFQKMKPYLKAKCEVVGIEYLEPELDDINMWISTYNMLKRWKILEPILLDFISVDESVRNIYPNNDDCKKINDTMTLLEPIESATHFLSAPSYPTRGDTCFAFISIRNRLSQLMNGDSFSQKIMAETICQELSGYWQNMDESIESSLISSLLDPRTKSSAFNSEEEQDKAKKLVLNLTEYAPTTPTPKIAIANDDARKSFLQLCWGDSSTRSNTFNSQNSPNGTIRRELEKYLEMPEDQVDPLLWWKDQQEEFPILSQVARDYLCIQAMSVIPKKVFSSEFIIEPPIRADMSFFVRLTTKNS